MQNETQVPTGPPAPCGYCRRCAIHDDPGGCSEVERWERENPLAALAAIVASDWMAPEAKARRIVELLPLLPGVPADPFDRAEAIGEWDDDGGFSPAGALL